MDISAASLSPEVWAAPQIQPDDLALWAARGIRRVISHRPDDEEAGQPSAALMAASARAAGLDFVHVPVAGMPGPAAIHATAQALEDGAPTLMFCRSGMRSAATWAMAERLRGGDADSLRTAALAAGYDLSRLPL